MSRLLKSMLMIPSGGAAKLEVKKEANIFSDYNLCSSVPVEELTITLTSFGTLSIAEIRLVATPSSVIGYLGTIQNPKVVAPLTSVYNLSTEATP